MPPAAPTPRSRFRQAAVAANVGRVGALILGLVLLVGAYAKLIDPEAFAELISREGLDFLLPTGAIVFVGLALEVGLGVALVLNIRRLGVLVAASILVAFFMYLTGKNYWAFTQGTSTLTESCGCFGNLVDRNPAEAFWQDLGLLVPATIMAWFGRPRLEDFTPIWKLVTTAALTLAAIVFAWMAPGLPLDNLATRLKPGVDLGKLCVGDGPDRTCFSEAVPDLMDDPETPGEVFIAVIADPRDESLHASLNEYANIALDGLGPPLIVLTTLSLEEIEDLQASELAPSFDLRHVPRVLLRPMYRSLPRSFLVKDGKVTETVSGLPPFQHWGGPADE